MKEQGRPGATQRSFCRPERAERTFYWAGGENHNKPRVDYWTCTVSSCGHLRIQMQTVVDAEGLVRTTVSKMLSTTSTVAYGDERSVDVADLIDEGMEILWGLYKKWDPARTPSFLSHASFFLPRRLVGWWRKRYGTTGQKPLGNALSLDQRGPDDQDDAYEFLGAASSSSGSWGGNLAALGAWGGVAGGPGDSDALRENRARANRRRQRLGTGDVGRSTAAAGEGAGAPRR